jgi:hypothetical protein
MMAIVVDESCTTAGGATGNKHHDELAGHFVERAAFGSALFILNQEYWWRQMLTFVQLSSGRELN